MFSLPKVLLVLSLVVVLGHRPTADCQMFTNPFRVATPVDPDTVVAGDLNGDGRVDLIWFNVTSSNSIGHGPSANTVTVLLNQSTPTVTGMLTSSPDPSYVGQAFTLTATLVPPSPGTVYAGDITFYVDGSVIGSATLSGNVATIAGPTTLAAGMHQLSATWPGDANDASLALYGTQQVIQYPLQITLACSPNPSDVGQMVLLATQFKATPPSGVGASSAPYTGTLSFYDGSTLLEQQAVASAGYSYSTSTLSGGLHTLSAGYAGDSVYAASTASCSEVVDKFPTTSQLSLNPVPVAGAPFQFVGKVAPGAITTLAPTGTVSFLVDGAPAGSGSLDPATGIAVYEDPGISGGAHSLSCSYGGDASFSGSVCAPVPVTVALTPAALTLAASANPAAAGSPVVFTAKLSASNKPVPGDVVTFAVSANGVVQAQGSATTDANGSATYTSPGLPPGTYAVSVVFAGSATLDSAVAPTLTEVVVINPTLTVLIASPNPGYVGNSVSLAATVTAMGTANSTPSAPSGPVAFFDGTTPIGTAMLNASGVAVLATTSLSIGVHSLSASYATSTDFVGSVSPAFSETILASTFTISLAPSTITVAAAKVGVSTINLASVGLFAGPLTLTNGAAPEYGTVAINPSAVTLTAGGAATSAITFNSLDIASGTTTASAARPGPLVVFPAAVLLLLPLTLRGKRRSKLLLLAMAAVLAQGAIGCGNKFNIAHTVAPGTYVIPLTATDANGNAQTANLTVVVTP